VQRIATAFVAVLLTMMAAGVTGLAGCGNSGGNAVPAVDVCINPPKDLRETYDCLRIWHARGAYGAMRPYLDPAVGEDLIDLLVAMDELMAANAGAQFAMRRACPEMDSGRYDLSYLDQYMTFFSKDVEYVREQDKGDEALVTVQIGARMPLEELRFRRYREGTRGPSWWTYVPIGDVAQVIPLIREATGALKQISMVIDSNKKITPEEVGNEFEIRIRQKILKKAAAMARKAAASQEG
jgi:hypothetical protein